jgi:hypothetical protein
MKSIIKGMMRIPLPVLLTIPFPQRSKNYRFGGHIQPHGKGFGAKKALQFEGGKRRSIHTMPKDRAIQERKG